MSTLMGKMTYLSETKEAIKNAIIAKDVEVSDDDTFRSYAEKIGQIRSGGTNLIPKTITENGVYNPADDDADGYSEVTVNVPSGGESIDGIYFDGTDTNLLRLWIGGDLVEDRDLEINVTFYTPSYQSSRVIFGNTANGYYPTCLMYNNGSNDVFRLNDGIGGQIDYVPTRFDMEHTLILNRLNDRAIIFDGDNIGTYGNYYLGWGTGLDLGKCFNLDAAEFVIKEFKLTKQSTSEVLADFKAGFRALSNGYKIPCLLNTVDGTYIDLNTGRPSGNNNGHIMVCQNPD